MSALARVTETPSGETIYLNPDYIRLLKAIPGRGTQITFSNDVTLLVKEEVHIVLAAIRGAK
jgi:uncharacterized protein YlzI (FlbEa/FlbD family)